MFVLSESLGDASIAIGVGGGLYVDMLPLIPADDGESLNTLPDIIPELTHLGESCEFVTGTDDNNCSM